MIELIVNAAIAAGIFIGTNIDDLLILTVLFLTSNATGRLRRHSIVLGQYLGIGILVAVSVFAAFGLTFIPKDWAGLLGLVPLGLGGMGLIKAFRARTQQSDHAPLAVTGFVGVAGITIANGADNITVYTPLFHSLSIGGIIGTITVFAALTAIWCLLAAHLGTHKRLVAIIERSGHWLVPAIFIMIGVVILAQSGVVGRLLAQ